MAFIRHNNNGRRHNNNHSNNRHRHPSSNGPSQQQGQNGQRRHVSRVNQVFESNGPDGRIRGTAQQIVEKYMTLARDASTSNDKVLSMNYFQHAEHYQRLLNEITEENAVFEREREAQRAAQQQSQPELSNGEAEAGFVDGNQQQTGDEQPRQQQERRFEQRQPREQREPRQEQRQDREPRQDRNDRPQREERAPRQDREARRERPSDDDHDDLDALPSFLQVPITTSAPAPKPAAKAPVETVVEVKPRAVRAPRAPRRTASDELPLDAGSDDAA